MPTSENVIAQFKRYGVPVYCVGNAAPFGRDKGYVMYKLAGGRAGVPPAPPGRRRAGNGAARAHPPGLLGAGRGGGGRAAVQRVRAVRPDAAVRGDRGDVPRRRRHEPAQVRPAAHEGVRAGLPPGRRLHPRRDGQRREAGPDRGRPRQPRHGDSPAPAELPGHRRQPPPPGDHRGPESRSPSSATGSRRCRRSWRPACRTARRSRRPGGGRGSIWPSAGCTPSRRGPWATTRSSPG